MKRGEIWLVNLDPTVGAEIKKTRPAVIVSNDLLGKLPLKIIVPITGWNDDFKDADWHVRLSADKATGLDKDSSADTFQVRSVAERRLVRKLGELDGEKMEKIADGLQIVLGLGD
jgi:mRNA interferase MazF